MSEYLANNAITTLVNSINSSITSIVVASASGFPAVNFRIVIDEEIMLVTAKSGNTFTVTRGVESTTAISHDRNSFVANTLIVQGLTNFIQQIIDLQ